MNLEEAIKRSSDLINIQVNNKYLFEEDVMAIQLGIEALERLKELTELANERQIVDWRHEVRKPLPSEGAK